MCPILTRTKDNGWFLPKDVRKQLSETFRNLKGNIVLEVFTRDGVNDEFSDYVLKFCADLAQLSDLISLKVFETRSARAVELGITAAPTLCINPDDYHIRFLGAPMGEEGKPFITAIMLVSLGTSAISDISRPLIKDFDEERLIQVFVSPSCPYCPGQVMNAIKFAIEKPGVIKTECIEMNENPELTKRFEVGSVPHTVFNDGAHNALGLMPEERFMVEMIHLRNAEELLEDGELPDMEEEKAPPQYGTIESGEVDLVIVGAGPAGLTAGIYAVRAGLKAVVLEKGIVGGQVAITPVVENYPGFTKVPGKQLMDIMSEHARNYVPIHEGEGVDSVEMGKAIIVTTNKGTYSTKAIILASGASYRRLGATGEDLYFGRGINYCASCDGFLYKGKKIAIIGGGNTALTDALHLKNLGVDVTIVHRRDTFRAQKSLQDSVAHEKIAVIWDTVVEEIQGDGRVVNNLRLRNIRDNNITDLPVDGAFVAIGQIPSNKIAKAIGLELKEDGFIKVDSSMRTSLPRVYAAGDLTGGLQQIVTAIGEGSIAAMSAFEDISTPYWKD